MTVMNPRFCNFRDTITVKNNNYQVSSWEGEDAPLGEEFIALDTETHMIEKGVPIKPVIMQVIFPKSKIVHLIIWTEWEQYFKMLNRLYPEVEVVMHNAPFDYKVCGGNDNDFLFKALKEDRITDTGIRFQLWKMEQGKFDLRWNLKLVSKTILNIDLAKDNNIRCTFDQGMDFMAPENKEHITYAAKDAIITALIRFALPQKYDVEATQLKGAVVLDYISDIGLKVDIDHLIKQRDHFVDLRQEELAKMAVYGIHSIKIEQSEEDKKAGKLDECQMKLQAGHKQILQELMQSYKDRYDLDFPITEKSGDYVIGTEAENLFTEKYGSIPQIITAYNKYIHYNKMVSTYIPTKHIAVDGRVHTRFTNILRTLRTSSREPNIQNLPRTGDLRGIYVAPEGYVIHACDFSFAELCTLAQTCYEKFGKSTLREIINSGVDPHTYIGQEIKKRITDIGNISDKEFRAMAKP
jgi:DNA polymerase I-like protein with 3'-5' exonuclease and polymerase domains